MGANIAGIYGAQIFRADDKPRYRRGFGIDIAVLAVGLFIATVRYVDDRLRRRRNAQNSRLPHESSSENNSNRDEKLAPARPSDIQPQTILIGSDLRPVVSKVTS